MKTFVMQAIDRVGFMDKSIPKPGPADAIIKTTMALICTSDSHTVHGAIGPRENLTLGHEAVGIVHEVGPEVRKLKPGDRVVSARSLPIGAINSRRRDIPRNPAARSADGSLPTSRMASSRSISTSTTPMRISRKSPRMFPTMRPSIAPICCRPASSARRPRIFRLVAA